MPNEFTEEETERRAREVARTLMSMPYERQKWGVKRKAMVPACRDDASTARKPDPTDEAS